MYEKVLGIWSPFYFLQAIVTPETKPQKNIFMDKGNKRSLNRRSYNRIDIGWRETMEGL